MAGGGQARRRRGHATPHRAGPGVPPADAGGWLTRRVVVAGALAVAALLLVPWLVGRATAWPPARAVAVLVALPPALYHWFRAVQRVRPRTAAVLAIAYGLLAAGIAWALTAA